jgi:hypothetical chaperone protein
VKYGFDFGTTNSAIAVKAGQIGRVIKVDDFAIDPRVIRTLLYFLRRELVISDRIDPKRLNQLIFKQDEISYKGEQKVLIGQGAINLYINENKFRHEGITRKILTGRWVVPAVSASADQGRVDPVPEYYEDVDFGTGRFIQGIKTALKSKFYKGTTIFGEQFSLEDLIATYVGEVKRVADKTMDEKIEEVVCGRPVYFSEDPEKDKAAQDRLEAGLKQAGFKKITFQFEPIAAAKQYLAESGREKGIVLVFDFGGGTLDTAIVDAENEKVLAADGVYIGGDLLNADICKARLWDYFGASAKWGEAQLSMPTHIYESLSAWYSIPNLNNPAMMQLFEKLRYKNSDFKAVERYIYLIKANLGFDLYEAIEKAKKQLSETDTARIVFKDGVIDIDVEITRSEFEEIIKERVEEIRNVVIRTLDKAKLEPKQIDVVVRTGGSSLIPVFERMLSEIFGREKLQQFETFTSIAAGLALE